MSILVSRPRKLGWLQAYDHGGKAHSKIDGFDYNKSNQQIMNNRKVLMKINILSTRDVFDRFRIYLRNRSITFLVFSGENNNNLKTNF